MFEKLFQAIFRQEQELSQEREIARHLAKVSLFELKEIEALYPDLQTLTKKLLGKSPYPIRITETIRSAVTQDKYYNQGRTNPGSVITNAKGLQSYHNYGLAFDIAFQGNEPYPKQYEKWKRVGELGESLGLVWGGRFNDNPHFEWHPEFIWQELEKYFQRSA